MKIPCREAVFELKVLYIKISERFFSLKSSLEISNPKIVFSHSECVRLWLTYVLGVAPKDIISNIQFPNDAILSSSKILNEFKKIKGLLFKPTQK